jgi:hypothetical protein
MTKPLGGRGQKAPYDTVQVRCPVPIKLEVEALIAHYRESVLAGNDEVKKADSATHYQECLKLVFKFIEESEQSDKLHTRNNVNLVRFRDWLQTHIDSDIV